jgi:hypothetical protein
MATRHLLPKGTQVTVRDSSGMTQEHSTQSEIDVTNASDARNPVTNVPCKMIVVRGYEVYFVETQIVFQDDETEEAIKNLKPWIFTYDIPAYRGIQNPSARLRRIAARFNLSSWITPEQNIPYQMISRLQAQGSNCFLVPVDNARAKYLVNVIVTNLRKDIKEATDEFEKATRNAEQKYEASDFNAEIKAKKYFTHTKLINKRMESLLSDLEQVVNLFHIDPNAIRLGGAMNTIEGIRNIIAVRCELINNMVQAGKEAGENSTGKALANAVENTDGADSLAVGVLADYLEENGEDVTAYRSAFAENVAEVPSK